MGCAELSHGWGLFWLAVSLTHLLPPLWVPGEFGWILLSITAAAR